MFLNAHPVWSSQQPENWEEKKNLHPITHSVDCQPRNQNLSIHPFLAKTRNCSKNTTFKQLKDSHQNSNQVFQENQHPIGCRENPKRRLKHPPKISPSTPKINPHNSSGLSAISNLPTHFHSQLNLKTVLEQTYTSSKSLYTINHQLKESN